MDNPNSPENQDRQLDTYDYVHAQTKEWLEKTHQEMQAFKTFHLYELFQKFCQSQKDILVDTVLITKLHGIESLFNREAIMGEATSWGRLLATFDELEELIAREIKERK